MLMCGTRSWNDDDGETVAWFASGVVHGEISGAVMGVGVAAVVD